MLKRISQGLLGLLVLASLGAIAWRAVAPTGLVGRYFLNTEWSGAPELVVLDDTVSTRTVSTRAEQFGAQPFSVVWRGFLYLDQAGAHTFTVTSDDGAWLYLDDRLLIDNGGEHSPVTMSATATTEAGLHRVELRYFNAQGGFVVEVTAAHENGPPTALSTTMLFPSRLAYGLHRAVRVDGYALPLLWSLCLLGAALWRPAVHLARHCRADATGRLGGALLGVLMLSLVVNAVGIWWGLPQLWSWAPDELIPREVLDGLARRFAGGWHSTYPPFHYYLLTAFYTPFLVWDRLGLADIWASHSYVSLFLLARSISVVMAVATVYVVYLCALELGKSRVAGLCSAFLVALMPTFIYYGKLANLDVPYVFWFTLSLLFYIRAIRTDQVKSYVWFAVTGMLSICTKDQAYGFYVLPVVHLVWRRYQAQPGPGAGGRSRQLIGDRRLRLAAGAAGLVFVAGHNLLFNLDGFIEHVAIIVGDASQDYQLWDRTAGGHLLMLREAVRQLGWSMSWPAFLLCLAGVAHHVVRGDRRDLFVLWPALSYYLFFIGVVMYHYDRFFLGVCVILALFGGSLLAELLTIRRTVRWRRLGVTGLFAYLAVYGTTVDLRMVNDARYEVEDWLRRPEHADATVAIAGNDAYLPRVDRRTQQITEYWPGVLDVEPHFIVINRGYSCRARPDSEEADFYTRLRDEANGYRLALAHRYQPPGPDIGPDRVWRAACPDGFTALATVNPEIQVFERHDR